MTNQNPGAGVKMAANHSGLADAVSFLSKRKLRVVLLSVLLVVPCVWHRRIEAGDLASHVYNAWLTQLIEKGQAPGLYIAERWNNVLFDLVLFHLAKLWGFLAAQRIVVSMCVLIFFWGVFAFVAAVTEHAPWFLTPCIAMLAYGYSFSMGFMNYYLSLGLACFGLAVLWRPQGREWIAGVLFAALALLAHPLGFLWLIGTLVYVRLREKCSGALKLAMPVTAAAIFCAVYWYASRHPALLADWDRGPFYFYNGADQLWLYGNRYAAIAFAAFFLGVIFVAVDLYGRRQEDSLRRRFALPFELYVVAFVATSLLPENMRPWVEGGWIGLLSSRLTTVSAILGLCILGLLKPRKRHLAGFSACAAAFFVFLYQDTGWVNRLEANAEKLVSDLPPGTRVLGTIWAQPGSRMQFVGHVLDRACIRHCFSYANYEPASGEFRVRARKGSPVAVSSTDNSEDMSAGEYEVDDSDLPLKQIYQCDPADLTKLCIRDLEAGEVNGRIGYKPSSQ